MLTRGAAAMNERYYTGSRLIQSAFSTTRIQSRSPPSFKPGVAQLEEPVLAPFVTIGVTSPLVGSIQDALMAEVNFARFTVRVAVVAQYAVSRSPSGVAEAGQKPVVPALP